ANQDAAVKPTITGDTGVSTFTDPDTGAVQNDPSAGTIYVGWHTINTAPTGPAATNFNPNTIKILASNDQGKNFTTQIYGDWNVLIPPFTRSDPNHGGQRDTAPTLVASQGNTSKSVPGGQLTVVYDNIRPTATTDAISVNTTTDKAVGAQFIGKGGALNKAV